MREILFRGKTQEHTRWIYGDLNHYMCDDGVFIAENGHSMHRVLKETVGQFTGLTDKNGNKVFEGDILSERPPMNQTAYIGYVAYDEELAVWRFMIKNGTKYNGVLLGSYSNSYKVIGNIHDNPELLKGGVENA